jgi:3-phenylpropionate/cinnamic acid dioxygenase small subunit
MQDAAHMKAAAPSKPRATAVDIETYFAIQQFLFFEAGLLDRRDYGNWLTLLTDDVTYRVLAYVNRDADVGPLAYALIDEPAFRLKARVEQILNAKLTHAENPPTLTRRFISNVVVARGERTDEYIVSCNLLVYRTRPGLGEGALYAGERRDVLRRMDGAWRIARREVRLDQSVLHGSISTLF